MDHIELLSRIADHLDAVARSGQAMNIRSSVTIFTFRDAENPLNCSIGILNANDEDGEPDHMAVAFALIMNNNGRNVVKNITPPMRRLLAGSFASITTDAVVSMDNDIPRPPSHFTTISQN